MEWNFLTGQENEQHHYNILPSVSAYVVIRGFKVPILFSRLGYSSSYREAWPNKRDFPGLVGP